MHVPAVDGASMRSAGRSAGRGAPLWLFLTALVLVPLLGVAVLAGAIVRSRMSDAGSAGRAEAAVRAVALLDAARSRISHEVVPALSLAVIQDPAMTATLGLPPALVDNQRTRALASVAATRKATDAALQRLLPGTAGAATAVDAAAKLAELRHGADAGTVAASELYRAYLRISDELTVAQGTAAAAATSEDVPLDALAATRDVQLVAAVAQAASRQVALFFGAQLIVDPTGRGQEMWQKAWLEFRDAERQMAGLKSQTVRAQWQEVVSSPEERNLDTVLAASADAAAAAAAGTAAPAAIPVLRLVWLISQADDRDAQLTRLMGAAVERALGLAAADRDRATELRYSTLAVALGVLLVSVLGALLLGRRVARSLRVLAGQADQVSKGRLVEVAGTGPREVRTVSSALAAAVGTLRRIQAQAQAVARGDLTDAVLDEPLPGPLGEVVHASVEQLVASVRQRDELQSALAHQATHDPLTELPNRSQARELVTAALHRARRSGAMTGLLFVDLDGFKAVNDAYGHAYGDEVLRTAAHRMRTAVRPGDVVCRLGGDEFVVLVEAVVAEGDLVELAQRLIAVVSEPIAVGEEHVSIGASVGVSVARDAGIDPDVLFAEADTAAYRAKQRGRGRAEVFDDALREQLTHRAELETAIAGGLVRGEMELHYQPVMDVATDRLMGYEALIRWHRPGHGMVPPDSFIPVAEGSRLICDLDRWVLGEATRQLVEWDDRTGDGPKPTVAVNISGRHLADPRVVADVADALAASGLSPARLVLEVTETVLVDDPAAIGHLSELRDLGVGIAIDDFGTGYTSIGQLGSMPVDTLKIDRSFVASAEPGHRELVALIIRAAHTFGLTVVAEGVEEPEQLEQLRADACDHAQGYLLHRPLRAEDAAALLGSPAGARRA